MIASAAPVARADVTWDPTQDRMAWTDRSTAADVQARIWLLTFGGAPNFPGRVLVTRATDYNVFGWALTQLSGLDSGLDAVSWTDGTTQRQRVFYVKQGGVYMLPWDNDVAGTPVQINPVTFQFGYFAQNTDLAAVTFNVSGTRWLAVASGATLGGQAGYLCIYESSDLGAHWWNSCSGDRPLPASNHDIVGVVAGGTTTPEFYFQNLFATLSRARRAGTNSWIFHEELSVPTTIAASIVATPAQDPFIGRIELGVIGSDQLIRTARITPTDTAPSWSTRAALPTGVVPASTTSVLGATACCGTAGGSREQIFVLGSNLGLYYMTSSTSGSWPSSWTGPQYSYSGYVFSVGTVVVAPAASSYQARVFGTVGWPTLTLQEFSVNTSLFNDYIKVQWYQQAIGALGVAIAETAASADTGLAIMTGTDRNWTGVPTSPWLVRLRGSNDGGNTYDPTDSLIQPFGGSSWFLTDATAAAYAGRLHHSVLEVQYPSNGCHHTGALDNAIACKVSHRRGASAAAISSLSTPGQDAFLIDSSNISPNLDHSWMVNTPDGAVHVVYAGAPGSTCMSIGCYWKLPSSGSAQRATTAGIDAPPAVRGANNEVYAVGDVNNGWSRICTLKNAFAPGGVQPADCTMLGTCGSPSGNCTMQGGTLEWTPAPSDGGKVYTGPEITQWASTETACTLQSGKKYKCFNTYALRAVAADPFVNYRVYVAYVAGGGSAPGIYFTRSAGGANWGLFTQPVLLAQNTPTVFYYDPQITVDTDGSIIVSFSGISVAPGDTSGNATFFVSLSGDGVNFVPWIPTGNFWNTSMMPYHCGRGTYFFGEYRDSNAFGNRAYLSFQAGGSTSSPYVYGTGWMNRWNIE